MTFSSCWIEALGAATEGAVPDAGSTIAKLGHPPMPDHYWPPVVIEWAKSAGLQIDAVDGAWLRVEVTAGELREFLARVSPKLIEKLEADGALVDGRRYLIQAEEF